jgi:hypothetical protein
MWPRTAPLADIAREKDQTDRVARPIDELAEAFPLEMLALPSKDRPEG